MLQNRFIALGLSAVMIAGAATGGATTRDRAPDADVVVTLDFDAYPVGAQITDQFSGLTFEYPSSAGFSTGVPGDGVVSGDITSLPTVVAEGGHSGPQAGDLTAPGEFGAAGTFVALSNLADTVSVYIGDTVLSGAHVELDAYDANRNLLGTTTAVTSGVGAQTLLTYSTGGAGTIAYVAIYRSDHDGYDAVIDDLTISMPPSTAPLVGVAASTTTYELGQGGTRALALSVSRLDNATGPVTLGVSGLPVGVSASFSENPVAATDVASGLTLAAAVSAPIGNYQVSLSATASGAASQAPDVFTLSIIAPLELAAASKVTVGTCSKASTTVYASVAPGLSGPVSFSVITSSSLAGISSALSQPQAPVTNSEAQTSLTLSSAGGTASGAAFVTASVPGSPSTTVDIPVQQIGPVVTSVDAQDISSLGTVVAGNLADTPRALHAGTTVEIYGNYFCNTATVAFGNPEATVTASAKHFSGPQGPYDYIRVTTPRDATSGPVTVTSGSPATSGSSSASLTVDSYRNAEAFNFHNFGNDLTLQDMVDAFGEQQVYLNFNPCGALTLGFANCPVSIVPDPVAIALLKIAQASMSEGTCFGISLTDQRFVSGQVDIGSFPGTGGLIYNLDGPATDSNGYATGSEPLLVLLKAQHLMQLSTEFLNTFLARAVTQGSIAPSDAVNGIVQEIDQIFAAGRYPMIELNDGNGGGGHVVDAYDLVPDGGGAYDIYVYDSNNPYTSNENSDGPTHANAVAASVVHLHSNGTWSLASTPEPNGTTPFQGGPSAIVVTDPASIPLRPTLPTLGGIAPGLLFSSAAAPGTKGANEASASRITQLNGAGGKTLYAKNGTINTDASTRLDAAPFAPLVGASAPNAPQLFVVGAGVKQLTVATQGKAQGGSSLTLVDGGFVGSVTARAAKGASGQESFSPSAGSVGFEGTSASPVSLAVDRVSPGGAEGVVVSASGGKGGSTTLALQANGAIAVTRKGSPSTFTMTLSSEPRDGLPATFSTGPIALSTGQTASVSKAEWAAVPGRSITVRVGDRHLELSDRAHAPRLVALSRTQVVAAPNGGLRLVVSGVLEMAHGAGSAVVVWVVRNGKHVIARHEAVLRGVSGKFSSSWALHVGKGRGFTFTAEVVAIEPVGQSELSSAAARSVTFSVK